MSKVLEVKNLQVSFHTYAGEVKAVRGIDYSLDEQKTLAIVGESGCGKSVMVKTLMGLIRKPGEIKEGSQILVDGKNILEFSKKEWQDYRGQDCSIVFQDAMAALNPTMTIGKQIMENVLNHKNVSKKEAWDQAVEMLSMVGLPDPEHTMKKYAHELSGGQRQRVMIAIALVCHPHILIADEPTTALDVTIQKQIIDLIKNLQKQLGMSVILITHDLGIVANIAHDIAVMYGGKIMEKGSARDIFYSPKHPYTWSLLKAVPRLDRNDEKLFAIEGMPPNLIGIGEGCPFADRCEFCMNICRTKTPPVYRFDGEHRAQCWLHDPNASAEGVPFEVGGVLEHE